MSGYYECENDDGFIYYKCNECKNAWGSIMKNNIFGNSGFSDNIDETFIHYCSDCWNKFSPEQQEEQIQIQYQKYCTVHVFKSI
jgi:DNA-directed RNA polymerase subunit RPC12/RpoP